MPKLPQNLTMLLLGILVVNVIGLWTIYIISHTQAAKINPSQAESEQLITMKDGENKPDLVATESTQIAQLKQQLAEVSAAVATLSNQTTVVNNAPVGQAQSVGGPQEYVLYLGSGSTTLRNWVEIPGTVTTINADNYAQIKDVEFQAGLSILGGEVRARLKNKTTGQIFNDSEVMRNSSTTTWVAQKGLRLHDGSNEYVVELRSTSGEWAQLEGARLKITVE